MNDRQRRVIAIALFVAAAMVFVPPWKRTIQLFDNPTARVSDPSDHRPIFLPRPREGSISGAVTYEIDLPRLLVYLAVLGLVTGGVVVLMRGRSA
jgi:hypothetical protein